MCMQPAELLAVSAILVLLRLRCRKWFSSEAACAIESAYSLTVDFKAHADLDARVSSSFETRFEPRAG